MNRQQRRAQRTDKQVRNNPLDQLCKRLVAEGRCATEDEALVDRLVAPGHPSTPGYNDPAYPLEGRVPRSG